MGVPARTEAGPSSYREVGLGAPLVRCGWVGVPGWDRELRVIPDGCLDVVWSGTELAAVRPTAAAVRFPVRDNGFRNVGVRLVPGVAAALLGAPAADLPPVVRLPWTVDGPDPLRELGLLVAGWARRAPVDFTVVRAARLLVGPHATVGSVAGALGCSERALRRRCVHQLGFGPKRLQRVLRLQRFLRARPVPGGLAAAARAAGYVDQAHLAHECMALTGSTPTRLWPFGTRPGGPARPGSGHVHGADSGAGR